MDFKEAYIDKMICHRFSLDKQRCVINHNAMDMGKLDQAFLKDFFIKPFNREKDQYSFTHPIDLKYNIIYNTVIDIFDGDNFVENSISIYKYLDSVSTIPSIKDGDIFIAKIEDVLDNDAYCEAVGIFKIETKNEFIETSVDTHGNMDVSIKTGYSSQKIDKACLIVFTEDMPIGFIIDKAKDSKFWRQDFLGMETKPTPYRQSKAIIGLMEGFVKDRLAKESTISRSEQIEIVNNYTDLISKTDSLNIEELQTKVFSDKKILEMFEDYRKIYEERENINIEACTDVDKTALKVPRKLRKIKLDDTVELCFMKTGNFIERGFDKNRGKNYYKIFFSKEV